MEADKRFYYKENEKMMHWIKENQEKFNTAKKRSIFTSF